MLFDVLGRAGGSASSSRSGALAYLEWALSTTGRFSPYYELSLVSLKQVRKAFIQAWDCASICLDPALTLIGLFPGAVFIIGSWFKQFETARRISLFYMASLLASGFGPIFAYALSLISVGSGMYAAGWRWIFIIEGVVTIAAGLIGPLFLVEFPERVTWLNEREKHIAIRRVRAEKDKIEVVHPTVMQSLKMMKDWKLLV
jgi:MFS family permease